MNALQKAKTAYVTNAAPIRSDRGNEYAAFAQVTRKLHTCIATGKKDFRELVEAVHENRKLWTILATDVARSENHLPDALRAQIFYLAEFTTEESRKILRGAGNLAVLVEINAAIMRGLNQSKAQK